jgi:hypothetical protein
MNDRRGDENMDRDSRHRDDRDGRGRPDGGPDSDRAQRGGGGADTRFLQLEMSRVLYSEAEEVAKPAFRELLLEAAKARFRERFGEEITRLARLAVDELLIDIEASLEIEEKIQRRREAGGTDDRLRDALARQRVDRGRPSAGRKEGRASASRKRRR